MSKMNAAVLHGINDIRFEEVDQPVIEGDHQVKIRVKVCGICKSDVPRVLNGTARYYPIILGHEFSGIVEEIGSKVTSVKPGDHVAGIPLIPCFDCPDCLQGNYSLCKNYSFIGSRQNGAYAEYVVVPDTNIVKIDDKVPFDQAALIETSTVALHGIRLSGFDKEPNKDSLSVAVIGTGTVGLFALQWAKILGAGSVAIIGRDPERLDYAQKLTDCVCISSTQDDVVAKTSEITGGRGFDYVFDAVGIESTIKQGLSICSNRGTICEIGTPTEDVKFTWEEWERINRKEAKLTGSWMSYSAPWPGEEWIMTVDALADGCLKIDDGMIHQVYPLSDAKAAFRAFAEEKVKGRELLRIGE